MSEIFIFAFVLLFASNAHSAVRGVHWGALPVTNYTSDQGLTLGALAQRFDYGSENAPPFENLLTVQATSAQRGPKTLYVSYELTRFTSRNLRLRNDLFASDNPYQNYYGLGNDSSKDMALERGGYYRYRLQQITFESSARLSLEDVKGLSFQAGVGGQSFSQQENTSISQFAKDFGGQTSDQSYVKLFARMILERRDSEFIPSQGDFAFSSFQVSPTWMRLDFDYRRYDSILSERWLWLASQIRYAATSAEAPLHERARLGSRSTLRGLPLNRYVGAQSVSLRTELRSMNFRMELFGLPLKAGQGIFIDLGRLGDSPAQLANVKTHFAYGFSLFSSYFTDDFLGGMDVGFSEGSYSFYFNLGHAF